ncbi:DUF6000 family protein [Streptomyces goshikiensis]
MPYQHPKEIGYGYVIERYAARKDSGHARYLVLKSGRFLRPEWPHAEHFTRHLIDDAAAITDAELEALLAYEWRSRLTAYLDRHLPRTDLRYDQPAALLRLDAHLGTHHADHFTEPGGLWTQWVNALPHLHDHPAYTPAERHRSTDLPCDFANGWTRP